MSNHRHHLESLLRDLAESLETKLQRERSLNDLFNDLDSAVIQRRWFQELWTPAEWQAVLAFDASWRAAVAKYNKLPTWRQFWSSAAGENVSESAAMLLATLSSPTTNP